MADEKKILPGQSIPGQVEETTADPKADALMKHLQTLEQESPEALAKRYGLTSDQSTRIHDAVSRLRLDSPLMKVLATAPSVTMSAMDTRPTEIKRAEELRQPTERSATEMIDALKKKEQTSYGDK
jgi:uncharacterized protein (DUF1697 family)